MKDFRKMIEKKCFGNQKKFAEMIGFAPQVISNIVSGRRSKPSYDVLRSVLSSFVDVNAEWLLTGKGSMLKSEQPQPPVGSVNDKYVAMLEDQLKDKEKINALQEEKIAKLEAEIQTLKSVQGTTVNQFNQPSQNKPITQPLTQSAR
ncbi:hypothetical protein CCAN12_800066 [Capnocytophaga canimorsus]|uniref:HTH cro/C1-type domain-containing protein n=1 Tax=Capnocytophaga canimorsus TaxID=28188 RepID=A0A0B7HUC8_9FLAO|nr:helix-turn-helix domain-containing protein [Capnocytophaga canimorsus]CEN41113.1 hypothetical protein CCAN12_800066 [Capnocytophaga canimorsus]